MSHHDNLPPFGRAGTRHSDTRSRVRPGAYECCGPVHDFCSDLRQRAGMTPIAEKRDDHEYLTECGFAATVSGRARPTKLCDFSDTPRASTNRRTRLAPGLGIVAPSPETSHRKL